MKILVYNKSNDVRLRWLTETLHSSASVGYCSTILENDVNNFAPDIVIYDSLVNPLPKLPGINLSSSVIDQMKPFVRATNEKLDGELYQFDACYYGDISQNNELNKAICKLNSIMNVGVFFSKPFFVDFFYGDVKNVRCLYRQSKITLCTNNKFQIYDIIYSGGNPVVFNNDIDTFIDDANRAITGRLHQEVTYEDIIRKHTNYDRMYDILKSAKLKGFASIVKNKKKEVVEL